LLWVPFLLSGPVREMIGYIDGLAFLGLL